jgi:hypothetical protein
MWLFLDENFVTNRADVILSNVEHHADVTAVESSATINLAEFVEESYMGIAGIESALFIALEQNTYVLSCHPSRCKSRLKHLSGEGPDFGRHGSRGDLLRMEF